MLKANKITLTISNFIGCFVTLGEIIILTLLMYHLLITYLKKDKINIIQKKNWYCKPDLLKVLDIFFLFHYKIKY